MTSKDQTLATPVLSWTADGAVNRHFQDPYFSRHDGAAESRHVFLEANDLGRRFTDASTFCIGELGFGTGLNFLLSWQLFRRHASSAAQLDYLAIEAAPLTRQQMHTALKPWPELANLQRQLLAAWPQRTPGYHLIEPEAGIRLLLMFGDVLPMLQQCRSQVDAWFFDGFAPQRNPAMWSAPVFEEVARLSATGASFATYTAAGDVRRRLQSLGFLVRKRSGFGPKRDMLCGQVRAAPRTFESSPWFEWPRHQPVSAAVIIGDGLAGACLARVLAERGMEVEILGQANGASHRIPGFLVRSYPERTASHSHRLYRQGFASAQAFYQRYTDESYRPIRIDTDGGPMQGGVLQPAGAIRTLLAHPLIRQRQGELRELKLAQARWQLSTTAGPLQSDCVILCCARVPAGLDPRLHDLSTPCAGQVLQLAGPTAQAYSGRIHGFPLAASTQLGSSYRPGEASLEIRPPENVQLLELAQQTWPASGCSPQSQVLANYTGWRGITPDHLPLIGPCPDLDRWHLDYADLHHGKTRQAYPPASLLPGLWLNLAHGSRGACLAPLAAQLIGAALLGAPLPLPTKLIAALHPGRFTIRSLRRGHPEAECGARNAGPA